MQAPPDVILGVLAKWPAPGKAKTRLIPLLGEAGAAQAAMRLLLRSLQWIDECPDSVGAVLWTDAGSAQAWMDLVGALKRPERWQLQLQPQGHLGVRMRTAMAFQLQQSACSLLMGTDTPTLGLGHVGAVCEALQQNDAAFVPALDGGYVMVGMRKVCEPAFAQLDWGSERVADQTRTALSNGGFSQVWLAPEPDLDEPADWENAVRAGWI